MTSLAEFLIATPPLAASCPYCTNYASCCVIYFLSMVRIVDVSILEPWLFLRGASWDRATMPIWARGLFTDWMFGGYLLRLNSGEASMRRSISKYCECSATHLCIDIPSTFIELWAMNSISCWSLLVPSGVMRSTLVFSVSLRRMRRGWRRYFWMSCANYSGVNSSSLQRHDTVGIC